MKGKLLIFLFILIVLITGCSKKINFDNHTNLGIINTVKNDSVINGFPKFEETYIFEDFESYKEYYHEFFEVNYGVIGLEELDFKNSSIILYNTFIDEESDGEIFCIEEVKISNKTIKVYITSSGYIKTEEEVNGKYYNYTDIVEIDKNLMPENYEVRVVSN